MGGGPRAVGMEGKVKQTRGRSQTLEKKFRAQKKGGQGTERGRRMGGGHQKARGNWSNMVEDMQE